jgi:hypothetical protein
MKTIDELLNISSGRRLSVLYPYELIDNIYQYPGRSVIVSSVKANDLIIPSLFFICPETDIEYFHIKIPPPEPNLKFRFLELENLSIIEIILRFGSDKDLTLHLNPVNKFVKHFLLNCIKVKALSFHFCNFDRKMLVSSFTDISDEELAWFERNYERSKKLYFGTKLFSLSSEQLSINFTGNQRYYKFNEITDKKILSENSIQFVQFGELKYN